MNIFNGMKEVMLALSQCLANSITIGSWRFSIASIILGSCLIIPLSMYCLGKLINTIRSL